MRRHLIQTSIHWALAGMVLATPTSGQTWAKAATHAQAMAATPASTRPLKEALNDIKVRYQVDVLFEDNLVRGLTVPAAGPKRSSAEEELREILRPVNLRVKRIKAGSYLVLSTQTDRDGGPRKTASLQPDELLHNPSSAQSQTVSIATTLLATPLPSIGPVVAQQPQEIAIQGKVTDPNDQALPGVNVTIKGTTRGTTTDANGAYRISVLDQTAVLTFSFIGYERAEVPVGNKTTIDVSLKSSDQNLSEVVVVGYGTQKKVNLTGSIATLDAKFIQNRPITNSTQALQGLPGVFVNQTKGRPGADGADIRIRGVGTLNGTGPLVLVDGIAYSLSDVNPNDIETISVLKDAASAAIYGNRAANGVILVTTKSGKKGKFQVDYNNYFGSQSATILPDVETNAIAYMEGKNRAFANEGRPAEYDPALIAEYKAGTDPITYSNTNWFDVMFRPAPIQEHNLRFSGGGDKTTFSVSLGYLDQKGIMINTSADRYTLGSNIVSDITPRLRIGANILGTFWTDRESAYTADEGTAKAALWA